MKLLEVENLITELHLETGILRVVDEVSFTLEKGKVLGIVGESGCGKTMTALSILRLIEKPGIISGGKILYYGGQSPEGVDLLKISEEHMRQIRGAKIAMIFQEPMTSLNPVFTVGDQILEAMTAHQTLPKREAVDRTIHLLEQVGIPDPARRMKDYPHQLSGGMRQRVMIAMALSCNPDILIADEPTTALDVTIQAQILELIAQLITERELAMILITHDLGIVAQTCDQVAVMYAGKFVEQAPVHILFERPKHPYTLGLLESIPSLSSVREDCLKTIPGSVPDLSHLPKGCRFQDRCPRVGKGCLEKPPPFRYVGSGQQIRCINA